VGQPDYCWLTRALCERDCRFIFFLVADRTTTHTSGNSSIDTSLIRDIFCGPEVLFETCVAMKFVDDGDDAQYFHIMYVKKSLFKHKGQKAVIFWSSHLIGITTGKGHFSKDFILAASKSGIPKIFSMGKNMGEQHHRLDENKSRKATASITEQN